MDNFELSGLLQGGIPAGIAIQDQPKFLIVVDREYPTNDPTMPGNGLDYNRDTAFGLTRFVETLENSLIFGVQPHIVKATKEPVNYTEGADIGSLDFATHLPNNYYDVIFLMGYERWSDDQLDPAEIDALATFMQNGGGVFATGDHEDHGGALAGDLPRIRHMRYWKIDSPNNPSTVDPIDFAPDATNADRVSTNQLGENSTENFRDQSDINPQPLYLNYRTLAANIVDTTLPVGTDRNGETIYNIDGVGLAHPLMQTADLGDVTVFPDHPHEGECRVPEDMDTEFSYNTTNDIIPEWPQPTGDNSSREPEAVAFSMSFGNGFIENSALGPKQPLTPRAFITICAYDGHQAGIDVGRIVTDSTWHHYVNVNIDGSGNDNNGDGLYNDTHITSSAAVTSMAGTIAAQGGVASQVSGTTTRPHIINQLQDRYVLHGMTHEETLALLKIERYYVTLAEWLMPSGRRRVLSTIAILQAMLSLDEVQVPILNSASASRLQAFGSNIYNMLERKFSKGLAKQLVDDIIIVVVDEAKETHNFVGKGSVAEGLLDTIRMAAFGAAVSNIATVYHQRKHNEDLNPEEAFIESSLLAARKAVKLAYRDYKKQLDSVEDIIKNIKS